MITYIDETTGIKMCCADSGPDIEWLVIKVEPKENYTLLITFITGEKKLFDMKPYIARGKVFAPLQNPQFFQKAHVEGHTVAWNDEIDIAPETLYEKGISV